MTRYHTTTDGNIPFSEAEELEADQREAEYNASLVPNAKAAKTVEVYNKFDSVKNNPVLFMGATFNGGIESAQMAKSKADMVVRQGEALAGVQPFNTTFNDINHNPVDLNTDQLQNLAVEIGMAYEVVFQKKARLKREIEALQTIEEITAFNVDIQWEV